MPSIPRILEILLYSVTIFVPWLLVTYYPFRSRLRFSANLAALLAAVMAVGRIAVDIAIGLELAGNALILQLLLALVYVLCFFATVRAPLPEMIANLLVVFALAFASTSAVAGLEQVLTPRLAHITYNWTYTIILLALEGIIAVVYCLFYDSIKALIVKAVNAKVSAATEEKPAEAAAAAPEESKSAPEVKEANVKEETAAPAPVAEAKEEPAAPAADTKAEPVEEQPESKPAPSTPQEPEVNNNDSVSADQLLSLQFTNLNSRILESRHVRGEVRRRIDTMTETLNSKDYDRLRAQMLSLRKQVSTTSYSTNVALSATLDYFTHAAANRGIQMNVSVQLSEEDTKNVYPNDLIVLVGDLLDNALEACKLQQNPDRRITISGKLDGKTLRFAVENTYQQPVLQDKDGTYQSSKYDGPGAGLKVVQSIAKRYAGSVKIDHTNGIFQVNVTLNP
ncbi:MAG: sensor histidine kinase [Oscillospiraceae bacterium]|nr:sensor histidine kinase [Oscillospiraceae bacterium]